MQDLDRDDLTHVRGGFGLLGGLLANRPILGGLLRFGAGAGTPGSGAPAGGNPSAAAATPMQPTRASGGCGS